MIMTANHVGGVGNMVNVVNVYMVNNDYVNYGGVHTIQWA